jgi:hypothetical protein
MNKQLCVAVLLLALASCGPRHEPEQPTRNVNAPVIPSPSAPPAVSNTQTPPPNIEASKPTVDPKSTEAAVELVQRFVDLLNRHKFDEAYMLLGPNAPSRSEFDNGWAHYQNLHVSAGKPGDQEGAAGSIYLTVPLDVSGTQSGEPPQLQPKIILRRVNDVPGSTEAQRHWHIERIDWGGAA